MIVNDSWENPGKMVLSSKLWQIQNNQVLVNSSQLVSLRSCSLFTVSLFLCSVSDLSPVKIFCCNSRKGDRNVISKASDGLN